MKRSGRTGLIAVLPLLLALASCTEPVVNIEEPEEVDSCEWLVPVGIELVNDYVYTLEEVDLGATRGDPELLPEAIIALNLRGEELDRRVAELDCDAVIINDAIAVATAGIESDDPVIRVFLESVRSGIVAPLLPTQGDWVFRSGIVAGGEFLPVPDHPITLSIARDSASGFASCNGYYYPVQLADGVWTWAEGAQTITELLCTDTDGQELTEVMDAERTYISAFELVASYALRRRAGPHRRWSRASLHQVNGGLTEAAPPQLRRPSSGRSRLRRQLAGPDMGDRRR
jgi:heat shock protein HslJ